MEWSFFDRIYLNPEGGVAIVMALFLLSMVLRMQIPLERKIELSRSKLFRFIYIGSPVLVVIVSLGFMVVMMRHPRLFLYSFLGCWILCSLRIDDYHLSDNLLLPTYNILQNP